MKASTWNTIQNIFLFVLMAGVIVAYLVSDKPRKSFKHKLDVSFYVNNLKPIVVQAKRSKIMPQPHDQFQSMGFEQQQKNEALIEKLSAALKNQQPDGLDEQMKKQPKSNSILDEEQSGDLAKTIYEAYCVGVGGVAYNGDKLPSAEDFFADKGKEKQVNGWRVAANAAYAFLNP
jgi:hypothetical protein